MYTPEPAPQGLDDLIRYVATELDRISSAMQVQEVEGLRFQVRYSAPDKPRVGQVYYADGTQWNPGAGEGLYVYTSAGYAQL